MNSDASSRFFLNQKETSKLDIILDATSHNFEPYCRIKKETFDFISGVNRNVDYSHSAINSQTPEMKQEHVTMFLDKSERLVKSNISSLLITDHQFIVDDTHHNGYKTGYKTGYNTGYKTVLQYCASPRSGWRKHRNLYCSLKSRFQDLQSSFRDPKSNLHDVKLNLDDSNSSLHDIKSNLNDPKSSLLAVKSGLDDSMSNLHYTKFTIQRCKSSLQEFKPTSNHCNSILIECNGSLQSGKSSFTKQITNSDKVLDTAQSFIGYQPEHSHSKNDVFLKRKHGLDTHENKTGNAVSPKSQSLFHTLIMLVLISGFPSAAQSNSSLTPEMNSFTRPSCALQFVTTNLTYERHPRNCSVFYTCFAGMSWKMQCPKPDTVFSLKLKVCVWKNSKLDDCPKDSPEKNRTNPRREVDFKNQTTFQTERQYNHSLKEAEFQKLDNLKTSENNNSLGDKETQMKHLDFTLKNISEIVHEVKKHNPSLGERQLQSNVHPKAEELGNTTAQNMNYSLSFGNVQTLVDPSTTNKYNPNQEGGGHSSAQKEFQKRPDPNTEMVSNTTPQINKQNLFFSNQDAQNKSNNSEEKHDPSFRRKELQNFVNLKTKQLSTIVADVKTHNTSLREQIQNLANIITENLNKLTPEKTNNFLTEEKHQKSASPKTEHLNKIDLKVNKNKFVRKQKQNVTDIARKSFNKIISSAKKDNYSLEEHELQNSIDSKSQTIKKNTALKENSIKLNQQTTKRNQKLKQTQNSSKMLNNFVQTYAGDYINFYNKQGNKTSKKTPSSQQKINPQNHHTTSVSTKDVHELRISSQVSHAPKIKGAPEQSELRPLQFHSRNQDLRTTDVDRISSQVSHSPIVQGTSEQSELIPLQFHSRNQDLGTTDVDRISQILVRAQKVEPRVPQNIVGGFTSVSIDGSSSVSFGEMKDNGNDVFIGKIDDILVDKSENLLRDKGGDESMDKYDEALDKKGNVRLDKRDDVLSDIVGDTRFGNRGDGRVDKKGDGRVDKKGDIIVDSLDDVSFGKDGYLLLNKASGGILDKEGNVIADTNDDVLDTQKLYSNTREHRVENIRNDNLNKENDNSDKQTNEGQDGTAVSPSQDSFIFKDSASGNILENALQTKPERFEKIYISRERVHSSTTTTGFNEVNLQRDAQSTIHPDPYSKEIPLNAHEMNSQERPPKTNVPNFQEPSPSANATNFKQRSSTANSTNFQEKPPTASVTQFQEIPQTANFTNFQEIPQTANSTYSQKIPSTTHATTKFNDHEVTKSQTAELSTKEYLDDSPRIVSISTSPVYGSADLPTSENETVFSLGDLPEFNLDISRKAVHDEDSPKGVEYSTKSIREFNLLANPMKKTKKLNKHEQYTYTVISSKKNPQTTTDEEIVESRDVVPDVISSQSQVETEIIPLLLQVEPEALPLSVKDESELIPSVVRVETEVTTSPVEAESEDIPSLAKVETEDISYLTQAETEMMPSLTQDETEVIPSLTQAETEMMPSLTKDETEVIPSLTQDEIEMIPSFTQAETEMMPSLTQAETEMMPSLTQAETEVIPSLTRAESEMIPFLTQDETEVIPSLTQTETEMIPSLTQAETEIIPLQTEVKQTPAASQEKVNSSPSGIETKPTPSITSALPFLKHFESPKLRENLLQTKLRRTKKPDIYRKRLYTNRESKIKNTVDTIFKKNIAKRIGPQEKRISSHNAYFKRRRPNRINFRINNQINPNSNHGNDQPNQKSFLRTPKNHDLLTSKFWRRSYKRYHSSANREGTISKESNSLRTNTDRSFNRNKPNSRWDTKTIFVSRNPAMPAILRSHLPNKLGMSSVDIKSIKQQTVNDITQYKSINNAILMKLFLHRLNKTVHRTNELSVATKHDLDTIKVITQLTTPNFVPIPPPVARGITNSKNVRLVVNTDSRSPLGTDDLDPPDGLNARRHVKIQLIDPGLPIRDTKDKKMFNKITEVSKIIKDNDNVNLTTGRKIEKKDNKKFDLMQGKLHERINGRQQGNFDITKERLHDNGDTKSFELSKQRKQEKDNIRNIELTKLRLRDKEDTKRFEFAKQRKQDKEHIKNTELTKLRPQDKDDTKSFELTKQRQNKENIKNIELSKGRQQETKEFKLTKYQKDEDNDDFNLDYRPRKNELEQQKGKLKQTLHQLQQHLETLPQGDSDKNSKIHRFNQSLQQSQIHGEKLPQISDQPLQGNNHNKQKQSPKPITILNHKTKPGKNKNNYFQTSQNVTKLLQPHLQILNQSKTVDLDSLRKLIPLIHDETRNKLQKESNLKLKLNSILDSTKIVNKLQFLKIKHYFLESLINVTKLRLKNLKTISSPHFVTTNVEGWLKFEKTERDSSITIKPKPTVQIPRTTTTSTTAEMVPHPTTTGEQHTTTSSYKTTTTAIFDPTNVQFSVDHNVLPDYRRELKDRCGVMATPLIIGGRKSRVSQWPWQVSLQIVSSETPWHRCGGVLIHSRWVLTAAHCLEGPFYSDLNNWRVVMAEYDLDTVAGTEISRDIVRVVSHPGYIRTSNLPNDVALVELDKPVDLTSGDVQTACLPDTDFPLTPGMRCWISGWGETRGSGGQENAMNEVPVDVMSHDQCKPLWGKAGIQILESHVCLGHGVTGACYGDSGGPLMCERDGRFYVAGVMSWLISNCSANNFPNVFTRLPTYMDWLNTQLDLSEGVKHL